jgi:preprotein translocase subunit SecY
MKTIKAIFADRGLRNRIFFVIGILVITRILAIIPIRALIPAFGPLPSTIKV